MTNAEYYRSLTRRTGLYNIMPLDNIQSIMEHGILSHENAKNIEHRSVALEDVQDRRARVRIPNGMRLHEYVNLYFDARNPMMYRIHNLAETLCVLKVSLDVLDLENVVVSDMNAACDYVSFDTPEYGLGNIDFSIVFLKNWNSEDHFQKYKRKAIKCAEVLVPNCVPYPYIMAAAVCSLKAKNRLEELGFERKIYIEPDCFFW